MTTNLHQQRRPQVFIASATEDIAIAQTVQAELYHDCEIETWSQGTFHPSNTAIDDLLEKLDQTDFGIFIVSPSDDVIIRKEKHLSARDNVIFELGLFIGRLGRRRTFVISPSNSRLRFPTDLLGLSPVTYDPSRSNIQAALGPACHTIRGSMRDQGLLRTQQSRAERITQFKEWLSNVPLEYIR